jgi:glycosyltransferase involved in cell wall biosynthesis
MDISIVVPVFNEEAFVEQSLISLLNQTYAPKQLVVVDDCSTDNSVAIIRKLADAHSNVKLITSDGASAHAPGEKVVRAFRRGFDSLSDDWDVVCKFDADIVFPDNYLENLKDAFSNNNSLGMFGGLLTIANDDTWVVEMISNKNHLRGPIKAYSRACFEDIGGIREVLGWDTLDELLALYHGYLVQTNKKLWVKHLRSTGASYSHSVAAAKGRLFYELGYGLFLGVFATIKWSFTQRGSLHASLGGFLSAWFSRKSKLVTGREARFIRRYRWSQIFSRFIS